MVLNTNKMKSVLIKLSVICLSQVTKMITYLREMGSVYIIMLLPRTKEMQSQFRQLFNHR